MTLLRVLLEQVREHAETYSTGAKGMGHYAEGLWLLNQSGHAALEPRQDRRALVRRISPTFASARLG
jgi:hypothetical protein